MSLTSSYCTSTIGRKRNNRDEDFPSFSTSSLSSEPLSDHHLRSENSKSSINAYFSRQCKRMKFSDEYSMDQIEQEIIETSNSREVKSEEVSVMMELAFSQGPHLSDMEEETDSKVQNTISNEKNIRGYFSMMKNPESIPTLQNYSNPPSQHSSSRHFPSSSSSSTNQISSPSSQCRNVASCWYCKRVESVLPCRSCDRSTCERNCLHICDHCQINVCSTCSMIDYSFRYERRVCIDCYYQNHHN